MTLQQGPSRSGAPNAKPGWSPFVWIWLLLLPLLLAACSSPVERLWLNAPGWKRALLVGHTLIPDAVPVVFDREHRMYFLIIDETDEVARPKVVAVNRRLEVMWETTLDMELNQPDQPQMLWDGERLHLFWLSQRQLFTAEVDVEGNVRGVVQTISGEGPVGAYDVALNARNQVAVWYAGIRQEPGLYALPAGDPGAGPLLLDEQGLAPTIQYSGDRTLHAAWHQHPPGTSRSTFYYAAYPDGTLSPNQERVVTEDRIGPTSGLEGPYFGIERDTAYLFWSVIVRTGLEAGTAETHYLTFPLNEPDQATRSQVVAVPSNYDLIYAPASDAPLHAGPRVQMSGSAGSGSPPLRLAANPALREELVVAAEANVDYQLRKRADQTVLLFFNDASLQGYQLLSFTRAGTTSPFVRSDEEGYLYATWLERADERGFLVYFSSTAPDLHAVLDKVTADDVGRIIVETAFGLLSGAVLAPFLGMLWLIGPLFILGLTAFMRRESEKVIGVGSVISLVLALVSYWVAKDLTLSEIFEYVPFSGWIPILPSWLEAPLRWGMPVVVMVLALVIAWRFTYHRKRQSAIYFMLLYTAVDSVLTAALYGSLIYGFI